MTICVDINIVIRYAKLLTFIACYRKSVIHYIVQIQKGAIYDLKMIENESIIQILH